jgi:hypothetical protein
MPEALSVLLGEATEVEEAPAHGNLGDRDLAGRVEQLGVDAVEADGADVGHRGHTDRLLEAAL